MIPLFSIYLSSPTARPTFLNVSTAKSRSLFECAAETWQRTRAMPLRHDGKSEARHEHPLVAAASRSSGCASAVSPTMIGTIGVSPASGLNPASVIAARKYFAFSCSFCHALGMLLDELHRRERARRHGRRQRVREELRPRALREHSRRAPRAPPTKPPAAPPSALPSVEVITSTSPSTPIVLGRPAPASCPARRSRASRPSRRSRRASRAICEDLRQLRDARLPSRRCRPSR